MNLLFKFSLKTVKPWSLFKLKVLQNIFMLILKEKNVKGKAVRSKRNYECTSCRQPDKLIH